MHIEKLSEKGLSDVIKVLFPLHKSLVPQKRFKNKHNRLFIADYFLEVGNDKIVFEFDGPTHFTSAKTQQRDIYMKAYCEDSGYILTRIPYFIQIDNGTLPALFPEEIIDRHNLFVTINDITCTYKSGFHDSKIIYPGDFNHHGWKLFWELYLHFMKVDRMSVMKDIHESLDLIEPNICLGIGWEMHAEKRIFRNEYPT